MQVPSDWATATFGPKRRLVTSPSVGVGRPLTPANPILFRPPVATPTPCPPGYSQVQLTLDTYECVPNSSFVIPGTLQTPVPEYRGTTPIGPRPVGVGATFKPAPIRPPAQLLAPQRPTAAALAVALQAYNNGSYLLGSGATIPQAVAAFLYSAQSSLAAWTAIGKPGSIGAIVAQIQQFQSYVGPGDLNVGLQAQNLAYAAMGTAGSTINPFGGVSGRADGVGVGRTLKPGNPILLRPPGTAPCSAGLVVDTVTGQCVAPCWDGSAPANGVCPAPVLVTSCVWAPIGDLQAAIAAVQGAPLTANPFARQPAPTNATFTWQQYQSPVYGWTLGLLTTTFATGAPTSRQYYLYQC